MSHVCQLHNKDYVMMKLVCLRHIDMNDLPSMIGVRGLRIKMILLQMHVMT